MRIWKYPLVLTDEQTVMAPQNARWLSVREQAGVLTAWALVDEEAGLAPTRFLMVGTGNPGPDPTGTMFLGTVQMLPFTWHVFTDWPSMIGVATGTFEAFGHAMGAP